MYLIDEVDVKNNSLRNEIYNPGTRTNVVKLTGKLNFYGTPIRQSAGSAHRYRSGRSSR